jgi:hypothetical protein
MQPSIIPSMQTAMELIEDMVLVFKNRGVAAEDKIPDLHTLSNQLFTVATAMRMRTFAQAALTFCNMLDRMRLRRRWNDQLVAVFIESFRRLRTADDNSPLAAKILEGLKRVAERADSRA